MKTEQTHILQNLSTKQLFALTTEVKETIATHVTYQTQRPLKAIDFWNLQRIQRSRSCGRLSTIAVR